MSIGFWQTARRVEGLIVLLTAEACDNAAMVLDSGVSPCCRVVKVKGDEITSRGAFEPRYAVDCTLGLKPKLRISACTRNKIRTFSIF